MLKMLKRKTAAKSYMSLLRLARMINTDMVANGFWPKNKLDRNYGEAVALIIGELCVEGRDALTYNVPLDSKDCIVEEIADAAIRHLDLMAGLGIEEAFVCAVAARMGEAAQKAGLDLTLGDMIAAIGGGCSNAAGRVCSTDEFGYEYYCSRYIYYPLLVSVEIFRKSGVIDSDQVEFIAMNADAFIAIFTLGLTFSDFVDRLLKKVEYNRTRPRRHGKTF